MPYICVHTNVTLTPDRKDFIKLELGRLLPIISGKVEAGLMVEILDGVTMYKAGSSAEPCAMVDVRCFKQAAFEENKKFTEEVLAMLYAELKAQPTNVYLTLAEFSAWGTNGTLRQ